MVDPVRAFRRLLEPEGQQVLEALPAYDSATALSLSEALRRRGVDEDLASAALTQARLRSRARAKFGELAERMYFTEDGLQQATRPAVAAARAQRYAGRGAGPLLDLCCGIGGDLAALAQAAASVVGVERDPLTAAVAQANAEALGVTERVDVRLMDVADVPAKSLAAAGGVFVDPARRGAHGRLFDPEALSPPLSAVLDLARAQPALGAKLGPGIPHALLPPGTEAEWVSFGGDVVECALWFGPLASDQPRRATLLPEGATVTGPGSERAPVGPIGRFLHEPDPAVIRAGLVAEVARPVGGTLLDPAIAYVTTDAPVQSPFLRSYEVLDVLPFSVKRLRAELRARHVGRLTIKKRGFAMEPDALRKQLRLSGGEEATVVLTRLGSDPVAILATPLVR